LGHPLSLDGILYDFSPQGTMPNDGKLKDFIELGVERGRPVALVAKAAYVQDFDPSTAFALYERAANRDSCPAQMMLAASYLDGVFTEINEAKAYYWWLIATRPRAESSYYKPPYIVARLKEHFAYYDSPDMNLYCPSRMQNPRLSALEKGPFGQEVKDLLLSWRPGVEMPETLDRFRDQRANIQAIQTAPAVSPAPQQTLALAAGSWRKVSLSAAMTLSRPAEREDLYERLSKSVYVIYAAPSKRALRQHENVAQGSGVAVERDTVLTNCHIVRGRPEVFVVVGGQLIRASVVAARPEADACVLKTQDASLSPVAGVK
jgi:TPR repeat protein